MFESFFTTFLIALMGFGILAVFIKIFTYPFKK